MLKIYINGREVKLLLRIRRISQKEMAERTGLSTVYISRLLNQLTPVGLTAQKQIQSVFKFVPFERLFTTVDK